MRSFSLIAATAAALTIGAIGSAQASIVLAFGENAISTNTPRTGASGSATLTFTDEGSNVRLSAAVTNTTGNDIFGAGATSSVLTGFGLDLVQGATFAGGFIGGTYLDTLIQNANIQPFGSIDVAGADNNNWQGGNANDALPSQDPDLTDTFSFLLSYSGSAFDLEAAFFTALTTDPVLTSAMRFQQVEGGTNNGASEKLSNPDVTTGGGAGLGVVPLPAAGWLLLAGVGGLAAMARRRKAAA
jgi:hypothetical protein